MSDLNELTEKYPKLTDLTFQSRLPDTQYSLFEAAQEAKLELIQSQVRAKMNANNEKRDREARERALRR